MDYKKQAQEILKGIESAAVVRNREWLEAFIDAQVQLVYARGRFEELQTHRDRMAALVDAPQCKECGEHDAEPIGLCDSCAHDATLCECGKPLEEGAEAGDFCPSCR